MRRIALVALLAFLAGCSSSPKEPEQRPSKKDSSVSAGPGLYDDLGTFRWRVVSDVPEAQKFFDQGLVLSYAFNHDAAQTCFEEAARLDPTCAMAHWGIALVNGPHINNPMMDDAHSQVAWDELSKARELVAKKGSLVEKGLVEALAKRYAEKPPADRHPLDQAYALAMRELWAKNRKDSTVGTLFVESLMDLHPWDLWTRDGKPKADTTEIVSTLEEILAFDPQNPGANHLYVHAMEGSTKPGKAQDAADRLRTLVPGAGHLVHMPAHIDIRVGHYDLACKANETAIAADRKHQERFPRAGFYRVYMLHNHHFLSFASMMDGRFAAALAAGREMVNTIPPEFMEALAPVVDGYLPVVFHVLVRFGRWNEVLDEPAFHPRYVVANAVRHYARGVSFAALGRIEEAAAEQAAFGEEVARLDERHVGNNPAKLVMGIPERVLAAEIAFRRGKADEAEKLLRQAVAIEDSLTYDEPPDWMMPVRHVLGAVLLDDGKPAEAEKLLEEDLERFPENGWSLSGLVRAKKALGDEAGARALEERFAKAWARSDVKIDTPCLCVPNNKQ